MQFLRKLVQCWTNTISEIKKPVVVMAHYHIGQIVQLKKPHPCGSDRWQIIRVGMDFRIKCMNCGRSVLIPRTRFERRVKQIIAGEV